MLPQRRGPGGLDPDEKLTACARIVSRKLLRADGVSDRLPRQRFSPRGSKRLHRVTAPTLLLWGAADRVNPPANGEAWRSRIKDAVLTALPGGHTLHHEAPQRAIRVTQEFLGAR